jgi:type II secretory pathway component PulF
MNNFLVTFGFMGLLFLPIIILFLAVFVVILVLSIFLPMMSMKKQL